MCMRACAKNVCTNTHAHKHGHTRTQSLVTQGSSVSKYSGSPGKHDMNTKESNMLQFIFE